MAVNYTYDDFYRAADAAGMLGQFSDYDLRTAQAHPEFGLSMLSLKKDYANAGTDEQRALIHSAGEELRKSFGSYSGGEDGSQYYAIPKTSGSTITTIYDQKIDNTLGRLGDYGSFSYGPAPTYDNAYARQQQALLDEIINRPDFSWSKETDPNWSSYKKSYLREGDRATANALAQASAGTGGRASTAAINAATQAGDYYATKLNDMIPTLYQQAYDRYMQEYQMKLSDLNAVNTQEQLDYNRYLTDLGQYNKDRSQAWDEYLNGYDQLQGYLGSLQGQSSTVYSRAMEEAEQAEAAKRYADQMAQQELENALAQAQIAASYGDYSGLGELGITPNRDNIYADALAAAGRVTPVGSGSGVSGRSGNGGTGGKGATTTPIYTPAVEAFLKAMEAGQPVPGDVLVQLLAEGYTMKDIEQAYPGFRGNDVFGASEDIYDDPGFTVQAPGANDPGFAMQAPATNDQGFDITGRELARQYALNALGKTGLAAAQATIADARNAGLITPAEMSELQIEIARAAQR